MGRKSPPVYASVRAVYQVAVAGPTTARVRERGGSTARAAWFTGAEAAALPLTELAEQFVQVSDQAAHDGYGK
jgi:8-oxo-dGTP diphosphatase